MYKRTPFGKWHWHFTLLAIAFLAFSGGFWEWQARRPAQKVQPAVATKAPQEHTASSPNSSNSTQDKSKSARKRAHQSVKPDRSNVDCHRMKCLALTFDDGPEPGLTRKLLHILEERNAVGTFFVLGSRVPDQADTMKRIVKGRHEIGNHTWTHRDLTTLPEHDIRGELNRTETAIMETAGTRPLLMRPPMGAYDDRVAAAVQMPLALWAVDPYDWRDRDAQILQKRVLEGAGKGKIVLLHDTYPETIQAMPGTIDELQRRGYVLVTVSELFGITKKNAHTFNGRVLQRQ